MPAKQDSINNSTDQSGSQSNLEEPEEKTLYCALQKIGVYNITTLMKRLEIPSLTEENLSQSSEKSKETAENKESNSKASSTNEVVDKKESNPKSPITDKVIRENSIQLLKLMGLKEANECACLLEKICLQGREMLGEISKPTIASAPMSKATSEQKAAFSKEMYTQKSMGEK